MSRNPLPASAVHLRIGRLLIDPGVPGADARSAVSPASLEAALQASLATRLGMQPSATGVGKPDRWLESLAGAVEERVRGSVAGAES